MHQQQRRAPVLLAGGIQSLLEGCGGCYFRLLHLGNDIAFLQATFGSHTIVMHAADQNTFLAGGQVIFLPGRRIECSNRKTEIRKAERCRPLGFLRGLGWRLLRCFGQGAYNHRGIMGFAMLPHTQPGLRSNRQLGGQPRQGAAIHRLAIECQNNLAPSSAPL